MPGRAESNLDVPVGGEAGKHVGCCHGIPGDASPNPQIPVLREPGKRSCRRRAAVRHELPHHQHRVPCEPFESYRRGCGVARNGLADRVVRIACQQFQGVGRRGWITRQVEPLDPGHGRTVARSLAQRRRTTTTSTNDGRPNSLGIGCSAAQDRGLLSALLEPSRDDPSPALPADRPHGERSDPQRERTSRPATPAEFALTGPPVWAAAGTRAALAYGQARER